jgi:hypothetical protein
MEEIEGPDIQCAAGQVDARWRGGFDSDRGHGRRFYATTKAATIIPRRS